MAYRRVNTVTQHYSITSDPRLIHRSANTVIISPTFLLGMKRKALVFHPLFCLGCGNSYFMFGHHSSWEFHHQKDEESTGLFKILPAAPLMYVAVCSTV